MILWRFTRCRINSKGSKGLNFDWNHTQLKFKPGTVEKNESTIGPPARIEHTLLRRWCDAQWQEHCKSVGSVPPGGPMVYSFFSTVHCAL